MKERFFFYGITLDATDIAPRHIQLAAPVKADLTNPRPSVRDGTAMATCKTADALIVKLLIKLSLSNVFVNDITQDGHN
jgi:acyl-coenzyme A thioesterase PaaI-like protein